MLALLAVAARAADKMSIRRYGCGLDTMPLVFTHIGKTGGRTVRLNIARGAADARNYTQRSRPSCTGVSYRLASGHRAEFCSSCEPSSCNAAAGGCRDGQAHEGILPCNARGRAGGTPKDPGVDRETSPRSNFSLHGAPRRASRESPRARETTRGRPGDDALGSSPRLRERAPRRPLLGGPLPSRYAGVQESPGLSGLLAFRVSSWTSPRQRGWLPLYLCAKTVDI